MKTSAVFLIAVALGAVGCSNAPVLNKEPVSVAGRVSKAGQPVGDVVVTFHPLDNGHVGMFAVKPDGTFLGELIAGNYSYYVAKSAAPRSAAALGKIDPKYYEPNLERKIAVEPGQELLIALD